MVTVPLPVARLYILGTFRVERDEVALTDRSWRLRSARMLVKALASDKSHSMHREALQDALWPHFEAGAAYNNFRKALHLARHAIEPELKPKEPSHYVLMADDVVSLRGDRVWVDADQFEIEARQAIDHRDVAAGARALALYGGDLLAEDRYVEWADVRREELRRLRILLLTSLADTLDHQGAQAAAMDRLREVLTVDPLHEGAHRGLMRAYALLGNRHAALRQYTTYADALQTEFEVGPDSETQALYGLIVEGELRGLSSTRAEPDVAPRRLPTQVRRIRTGPLVSRTGPMGILTGHLQRTLEGTGGLVFISGEAGAGKSRLVAELAHEAQAVGATVLWGTSYAEEGLLPYGAVAEALDSGVVDWPESEKASLAAKHPEVAPLMPALPAVERGTDARHHVGSERTRLFAGVTRALTDIAGSGSLLIVLDDLHAADDGTLQLLHYLARSIAPRRWLIVGVYREEEVPRDGALHGLERATAHEGLSEHVEILRLSREDAESFARSLVGGGVVDRDLLDTLYARSLGNPLFLQQLLIALREADRLEFVGGSWRENARGQAVIPTRVRELITLRLERLDEDTRHALTLAAVIGMHSPLAYLRSATHLDEARLLTALDAAVSARFLDEVVDGFVFRHPLFRETLFETSSQARRSSMHQAIAEALERIEPDEVEALAYHFARSGKVEPARRYYEAAGDRANAIYARKVALRHYRDALQHSDQQRHAKDVARVTLKMADVHITGGEYDEALRLLERAAALYAESGGSEGLGTVTARIGYVHAMRGTPQEGADRVRSLLATRDPDPSSAGATLLLQLARLEEAANRYEEELHTVERASHLATEVGDEVTHAEAEGVRGHALMLLGRVHEATAVLKAAIPPAEAARADTALIDLEGRLCVIKTMEGACDESAFYAERAVNRAEMLGDPVRVAIWGCVQALGAIYTGEWTAARRQLDRCVELNASLGDHQLASYPLFVLGRLLVAQGNFPAAHRALARAKELSESCGSLQARRLTARGLGELHLLQGQPQQALDLLLPLLDRPTMQEWEVTSLLPTLAESYRDLDRPRDAMNTIDEAIVRARQQGSTVWVCEALPVRGTLLAAAHRFEESQADFAEACTLARRIRYPLAEGRALAAQGRALTDTGQQVRAATYLHEARSIFRRLGARRDETAARDALRHLTLTEPPSEETSASKALGRG